MTKNYVDSVKNSTIIFYFKLIFVCCYLKSVCWKFIKNFYGLVFSVVPFDVKYEKMLNRLEEAIEDGRTNGDCQAKYKCFTKVSADHIGLT